MYRSILAFAISAVAASAQDCGDCQSNCQPATPVSVSGCTPSMEGADGPLTVAHARKVAFEVRAHVCASISKVELQNHLAFVRDGDTAELLAARIREADSLDDATIAILDAAVDSEDEVEESFEFAPTLSATGFYASTKGKKVADGFVPYVINSPLWSDGAHKDRFVRVPAGKKIRFRADSEWDFPVGTTFLQTMHFAGEENVFTETRVIVRGKDELHFASYAWDDEAEDAELVDEFGDDLYANHGDVSQLWSIAAREDCAKCHNPAVQGRTLGVTTAQMNRISTDGKTNQLALFQKLGLLDGVPADISTLPKRTDPTDPHASLDARARSYIATNCSSCHRPGGPGSGTLDLRLETKLEHTGLLKSGIVFAGEPRYSRMIRRMNSIDWDRMPSLLSTVPDEAGMKLLSDWVREIDPGLRHQDAPPPPPPAKMVKVSVQEECCPDVCCPPGCCEGDAKASTVSAKPATKAVAGCCAEGAAKDCCEPGAPSKPAPPRHH